ncbi:hypothetical protein SBADM41S_06197 [Streptomyces badius]
MGGERRGGRVRFQGRPGGQQVGHDLLRDAGDLVGRLVAGDGGAVDEEIPRGSARAHARMTCPRAAGSRAGAPRRPADARCEQSSAPRPRTSRDEPVPPRQVAVERASADAHTACDLEAGAAGPGRTAASSEEFGRRDLHRVTGHGCRVHGGAGRSGAGEHVGAEMFDRLERSDERSELLAVSGVLDGRLGGPCGAAELFGGGERRGLEAQSPGVRRGALRSDRATVRIRPRALRLRPGPLRHRHAPRRRRHRVVHRRRRRAVQRRERVHRPYGPGGGHEGAQRLPGRSTSTPTPPPRPPRPPSPGPPPGA